MEEPIALSLVGVAMIIVGTILYYGINFINKLIGIPTIVNFSGIGLALIIIGMGAIIVGALQLITGRNNSAEKF